MDLTTLLIIGSALLYAGPKVLEGLKDQSKKSVVSLAHPDKTTLEILSPLHTTKGVTPGKVAYFKLNYKDVKEIGHEYFPYFVNEIAHNKAQFNEVIVEVNSPGGPVFSYGELGVEMARLRTEFDNLTGLIPKVAASGGCLAVVPCKKIIAGNFAYVGSVGVVTEFLNFAKAFNTVGIEAVEATAGEAKRSVTPFSEVTDAKKEQLQKSLDRTHEQFKSWVSDFREQSVAGQPVSEEVFTADVWTAGEAENLGLNLVDEVGSTYGYLHEIRQTNTIVEFKAKPQKVKPKSLLEGLLGASLQQAGDMLNRSFLGRFVSRL